MLGLSAAHATAIPSVNNHSSGVIPSSLIVDAARTAAFDLGAATRGTGLNPDSVSVALPVKANELLIAGLTYSTAGPVSGNNAILTIKDSQGLTWIHILNSGITGGDKGVDLYHAVASSTGNDTLTIAPASTTYKTGFVSSWGTSTVAVDVAHAFSTCDPGFASSITTTVTTGGQATIGVFSADDGQINSASGPGTFHFDLYNGGPNGVSINVDDALEASSGTFTNTWSWSGSTTACTIAVPISNKIANVVGTQFDTAAATRGTGLNPDPVSVSLSVKAHQLLISGLTYSTAGPVSGNNAIASITDTQGLTWHHILNSGITGGDKGLDIYYAIAASTGTDTVTLSPVAVTYKTGFVSSWGTTSTSVDVAHAFSTCDPGFASSITTTVTTGGRATIAVFSADDGQISSAAGSGSFHFDFYNGGPNGVSVNVDDAVETSSGTFTNVWGWSGSTTACTIAVPITK